MKLLDLFCGAGGCAVGYHRAGFTEIVGVDINPQPRYPFTFVQADALEYLRDHGHEFDAIHASPPCQAHSSITRLRGTPADHPDLVAPTRDLLTRTGKPWVIENVVGAPLECPVMLCGSMFDLGVRRHRLFESNVMLLTNPCRHAEALRKHGRPVAVYGHPGGGASATTCKRERKGSVAQWKAAMGIDWMTAKELAQAIPPAYTEFIGRQLMAAIIVRT